MGLSVVVAVIDALPVPDSLESVSQLGFCVIVQLVLLSISNVLDCTPEVKSNSVEFVSKYNPFCLMLICNRLLLPVYIDTYPERSDMLVLGVTSISVLVVPALPDAGVTEIQLSEVVVVQSACEVIDTVYLFASLPYVSVVSDADISDGY